MAQNRSIITRSFYDALLIAYRECPNAPTKAARAALCDCRTAKRGWDKGWPRHGFRAIKDVIAEEQDRAANAVRDATRRLTEDAEAQREKGRAETAEAIAQERQMLKAARGDVIAALVIAAELIPAMRLVARAVAEACKPGPDGSPPQIPAPTAMGILTRHATLIQKAVGATEAIVQLSRLDRGASTVNIGGAASEDLTLEQAIEELEALDDVLTAARARPQLGPAPSSPTPP